MTTVLAWLFVALTLLQGLIMAVDEFYFHRQRGLPSFERWGHVADTGVFLAALLVPPLFQPQPFFLTLYGVLAVFSCFLITKDEWIHAASCNGAEQWCHAMLFVLHGPILLAGGVLWYLDPQHGALKVLPPIVLMWGLYQHLYWNVYHDRKQAAAAARGEQPVLRRTGRTLVQR